MWRTFRAIPKLFKEYRSETKYIRNLQNMEKEEGMIGTFLHVFETELMDTLPDEVLGIILLEFVKEYKASAEPQESDALNSSAFNSYCIKYGIEERIEVI